jgi:hypothetical protein
LLLARRIINPSGIITLFAAYKGQQVITMADSSNKGSNKKRKQAGRQGRVKIHVQDSDRATNPIVVSFPGGLPEALQKGGEEKNSPSFSWSKLSEKSKVGRSVVGIDEKCKYSAQSNGLLYDERRTKLCVGVYDKKRGVLTIHEAASRGTVYALEQSVPAYQQMDISREIVAGKTSVQYGTVFEDFGSQKKRKVLKSQQANVVNVDHVVGAGDGNAMVDKVVKGESMSESNKKAIEKTADGATVAVRGVDAAVAEARRNFLPKFDEKAKKSHLVYDAKAIIGKEAWSKLHQVVSFCMNEEDVVSAIEKGSRESDWNGCIKDILKDIPRSSDERFVYAIFLNWTMNFYNGNHNRKFLPTPDDTRARHYGIPIQIALQCFKSFATAITGDDGKHGYVMTKANKDSCLVHMLLLYMMSGGKIMKIQNLKPIAIDLKITVNDAAQLLRQAGCTVTKAKGDVTSAVLKVPLTFPQARRPMAR